MVYRAELIPNYRPPGHDVRAAADQVRGRVPQIEGLAKQVESDHKTVLDTVAGDLKESMADAPATAVTTSSNVIKKAEFAAGCLQLFAQKIDEHNYHKSDPPRSVALLNDEYNDLLARAFDVDYQDPGPGATQEEKDKAYDDFVEAYGRAKEAAIARLRQEAKELDAWLDGEAEHVRGLLQRGPDDVAAVRELYGAGALPPYAAIVFPGIGLERMTLPEHAQRELKQYLLDHPELLINMPPALAAVVANLPKDIRTDIYVEQRMEHLRRRGLLTGDNPGGYYEQWIRNTVENGVSLDTVIAIARDHDIRPDDFAVLNNLREIKDHEGKSFFLLPTDISGDEARKAVLMTYILNAGTGYGVEQTGDFTPEPYSSAEVRRIIERQDGNGWSYSMDVDFVHGHGGRLVTTPNGMLMGAGGDEVLDPYSQAGGSTWGDIFMINEDDLENPEQRLEAIITSGRAPNDPSLDLDRLLHHEERHSQQWDREFGPWYGARYLLWESFFGLKEGWSNAYERDAGLTDGGYDLPPTPNPQPGPSPTPQPTPTPSPTPTPTPEPSPTPSPSPGPSPTPPR